MSIQAVSWVLEYSEAKLGARLVLIAIANHADKHGCNAFPSLATIAAESHLTERQVRRALRTLEKQRAIVTAPGAGLHGTNLFQIVMGGTNQQGGKIVRGEDKSYRKPVQNVPQTVREPSYKKAGYKTEPLSEPTESSNTAQAPSAGRYAFAGKVIHLTEADWRHWRKIYHGIPDLDAELWALDAFYDGELRGKDRTKWFVRCSTALDKKHQAMMISGRPDKRSLAERYPNEGVFPREYKA